MRRTVIKNGSVYYQDEIIKTDIAIEGDRIVAVGPDLPGDEVIDAKDKLVIPGLVDMHVHLREPGFEHKGTIESETLAAKYGGYTHIVAMANTFPAMDKVELIRDFRQRVENTAHIHTYTYSAITKGLKGKELVDFAANVKERLVMGFSDDGVGVQSKEIMAAAMREALKYQSIIVAHCEDNDELEPLHSMNESATSQKLGLVGINNASEYKQVERDLELSIAIGNRYHICHMSTKESVAALRKAKKKSQRVSGEVCPHHLILTDENIKNLNPNYKMNPPLRSKADLNALIAGLNDGTIRVIATDHAPHAIEEKEKPFAKAPFGIIGSQHCFSLVYTYLVKTGLVPLERAIAAMTVNPADILGFSHGIKVDNKADIVIFDLNEKYQITKENIKSKAKNTPFLETEVYGVLKYHIMDGNITKI